MQASESKNMHVSQFLKQPKESYGTREGRQGSKGLGFEPREKENDNTFQGNVF